MRDVLSGGVKQPVCDRLHSVAADCSPMSLDELRDALKGQGDGLTGALLLKVGG
jgi:hypothetical protein